MRPPFEYSLYLVTNEEACLGRPLLEVVELGVKGGVDLVQLREKMLPAGLFLERALRLKELLDRYNVPLVINDCLNVAMHCHAAGIHVGNTDTTPQQIREIWPTCCILGYSVEQESQIDNEHAHLSSYLAVSPVFTTKTKPDAVIQWGVKGVAQMRDRTAKPLVAIGNIGIKNARHVLEAGADCLAVVSAICSADDPAKAAENLRTIIEKYKRKPI